MNALTVWSVFVLSISIIASLSSAASIEDKPIKNAKQSPGGSKNKHNSGLPPMNQTSVDATCGPCTNFENEDGKTAAILKFARSTLSRLGKRRKLGFKTGEEDSKFKEIFSESDWLKKISFKGKTKIVRELNPENMINIRKALIIISVGLEIAQEKGKETISDINSFLNDIQHGASSGVCPIIQQINSYLKDNPCNEQVLYREADTIFNSEVSIRLMTNVVLDRFENVLKNILEVGKKKKSRKPKKSKSAY